MVVPEGSYFYRVTITHEGAWVMEAINAEGSVFLDALNAQAARFGAQLVISHVARRVDDAPPSSSLLHHPTPRLSALVRVAAARTPTLELRRQRSPRVTNRAIMVGQRAERRTESFGSNSCGRQRRSGGTPPGCTRRCAARRQPVAQTCEARTPRAGERRGRAPRRSSGRCLLHNPLKQLAAGTTRGREDDCAEGMPRQYTQQERQRGCGHGAPISRPNASARHAQKMAMLPSTRARSARTRKRVARAAGRTKRSCRSDAGCLLKLPSWTSPSRSAS